MLRRSLSNRYNLCISYAHITSHRIYISIGPLASLVGTWSGSGGLSITGVPSRKSKPDAKGEFELIVRPYKEQITFEAVPGTVKQRGGSTEQFSGVVTYKKKVYATDDTPELIHVEDG